LFDGSVAMPERGHVPVNVHQCVSDNLVPGHRQLPVHGVCQCDGNAADGAHRAVQLRRQVRWRRLLAHRTPAAARELHYAHECGVRCHADRLLLGVASVAHTAAVGGTEREHDSNELPLRPTHIPVPCSAELSVHHGRSCFLHENVPGGHVHGGADAGAHGAQRQQQPSLDLDRPRHLQFGLSNCHCVNGSLSGFSWQAT